MDTEIRIYTGGIIYAVICGDIDHHTAKGIRSDIDKAIIERDPKLLILDFSRVTFMDSSGIGLVMGRYRQMTDRGGEVILTEVVGYIRKVFQLSGIDRLTKIVGDVSRYIGCEQRLDEEDIKEEKTDEAKAY